MNPLFVPTTQIRVDASLYGNLTNGHFVNFNKINVTSVEYVNISFTLFNDKLNFFKLYENRVELFLNTIIIYSASLTQLLYE